MRTRLCSGLREERRVAVAKPMPDEPPVITMVFGADLRLWNAEALGWKTDMISKREMRFSSLYEEYQEAELLS